jgi:predicted outer membrane protein
MAACALLAGVLAGGGCGTGRDGRLAAGGGGQRAALLAQIDATLTRAIEQSRLASARASDADLRRFATLQVARYTGLRTELRATTHDEPAPSPLVATLAPPHAQGLAALRAARGAQFDRAYVRQALEVHRRLLGELDRALQRTRDDDLRRALRELRDSVPGRAAAAS